jgi:hypothetical protein
VLWIVTFITSIPAVLLYDPLLNDPNFILGAGGGDTRIFIGATLELLLSSSPTSEPPFCRSRSSSATTNAWRSASSPRASSSAGSSRSGSSASWRS